MTGYWHHHVVCPYVCNAVHCGSRGYCTGLKVVPACSCTQVPICPNRHKYFFP